MAVGTGANGKSIFLDTLEHVFSSYAHRAPMRLFANSEGEADRFSLADLHGARIVFAAETKANTRMNEHVIKALTGGETLSGERKYAQPFTFRPTAKIWLGVNHNPTVSDDSFGFWRRVRLIPFNRTFSGDADDRELRDTLRQEAEGIFTWAINGCLRWQEQGLIAPDIVLQATKNYEMEEDPLTEFLQQNTKNEANAMVLFSALYAEYKIWAKEQGITVRSQISGKAMGANLKKRGYDVVNGSPLRKYHGLSLLTNTEKSHSLFGLDD
jgi:putative DNA primase/helicase